MFYNLPDGRETIRLYWKGFIACLGLSPCFALCSLKTSYSRPVSRSGGRRPRITWSSVFSWLCCSTKNPRWGMRKLAAVWACRGVKCSDGASGGRLATFLWPTCLDEAARSFFPPLDHALVKALACELVAATPQPLSRQSLADVTARAHKMLSKPISRSTVWRILDRDALKPWRYKYWIFPRDPHFTQKAGPLLDLYAGHWQGRPLGPQDHILSADEKTSIQARLRCHPARPPAPGYPARIEYEYERKGALQYLAAWAVRRGYVIGRCEPQTGIEPFGRLVDQVLAQEPYRAGERLFWLVDNGSSHRGEAATERLRQVDSRIILLHTPVHASWLNQVEIYFSIIQRKVLTPNDFADLETSQLRLALYEELSNQQPAPFQWKFDRAKLSAWLAKIEARQMAQAETQLTCLAEAA